jgi:hypothetical protein
LPFLEDYFDESARYVVSEFLAEFLVPLKDINETTLLLDELGTPIGFFEPAVRYGTMVDGKPTVPYSDEEIRKLRMQRRTQPYGRTLQEILSSAGLR